MNRISAAAIALASALWLGACGSSGTPAGAPAEPPAPSPVPSPAPAPPATASLTHDFGEYVLGPAEEVASQCVSWTLDNDEALYVHEVTVSNSGSYHHSNWFVVPEDVFPGPDGYFRCRDRDFSELGAAVAGTVLFAQSTQSQLETQTFIPGAAVKIPPRHKVVSGIHLLNPSTRTVTTQFRMTLGLVHPRDVEVILTPFRLSYYALDIPPRSEARYSAECDLDSLFRQVADRPIDMKLYWILPHYHYRGNYFRAEIVGGPRDGELLHGIDRFDAEANGKMLDPPVDFRGATGIRMTCGFRNPTDEEIGWGIGDQEMCVMLGLATTDVLMDAWVDEDTHRDDGVDDDGIHLRSGACEGIAVPPNPAQVLPTPEEIEGELYVPETQPDDIDLPPVLPCIDVADSEPPEAPVTFSSIRETVLTPSCTFSACHDSLAPVAGLDLETDPYDDLLARVATTARTDLPLVTPGDPSRSWLYRLISRCEPTDDEGNVVASMPRNAPGLLDPAVVAKVRAWIEAGAPND